MKSKVMILSMAALMLLAATSFGADKYMIDKSHSSVGFSVRHMVISSVKGSFTDFDGTIMFDEKDITKSSVNVTIKAESIDTNDENRDDHLRNEDFFDVAKYPEITFVSTKIEKSGDEFIMHGNFTMHGVTKEISMPFEINGPITDPWGNIRFGAESRLKLDRKDYGIVWNKTLDAGGLTVGNEVKIELHIEAVKAK